jgi:hypothetical protein
MILELRTGCRTIEQPCIYVIDFKGSKTIWRREWGSNPRYSLKYTRFPSVRLKPLGHLSGGGLTF